MVTKLPHVPRIVILIPLDIPRHTFIRTAALLAVQDAGGEAVRVEARTDKHIHVSAIAARLDISRLPAGSLIDSAH